MTDYACTFAATPTNLYPTFEKVTAQPGCCTINGVGTCTTAYGLNNTCHILKYIADGSDAAPYRITILTRNAGHLKLSDDQCMVLVPNIQENGEYSTGNGMGPNDAGLASKYGYDGCTIGAGSSESAASAQPTGKSSTAGYSRQQPSLRVRHLWLLGMVMSLVSVT